MNLANENADSGGFGILQPQLANRFRVLIEGRCNPFTLQVISCSIDYLNRTVTIVIQQPLINRGIHEQIYNICKYGETVYVDQLAGDGKSACRLKFSHAEVKYHEFSLDYAKSCTADHTLVFKFSDFSVIPFPDIEQ
jgi:hypothetical protein